MSYKGGNYNVGDKERVKIQKAQNKLKKWKWSDVIDEYNLIQEKKSTLPASIRMEIVVAVALSQAKAKAKK